MQPQNRPEDLTVISFSSEPVPNHAMSVLKGRPIFDDVEMITFRFAGDTKRICTFPAVETDPNATREQGYPVSYAEAYPEQYRKFKASEQQTVAGTPVAEAPFLTEGKRRELRALNIHSIEALAALDGQNLKTLGMGGRELKNQAVAYLARAQGSADVTGMAAQLARMKENIDMLMAENARLARLKGVDVVAGAGLEPKDAGDAGADGKTEKSLEDCTDQELRDFVKEVTGRAPPANTGRTKLIELATAAAAQDDGVDA